ncbi:MAG: S41 family peptidase [Pseudomonadota bacterium]
MSLKSFALLPLIGLLVACGGGGGGGAPAPAAITPTPVTSDTGATALASAASLAQQCAAPRTGTADRQGSIDTEKSWVRSFMDETYLWYKDIPVANAANFTLANHGNSVSQTLDAYFQALKTKNLTASGKLVDQFSFTLSTVDLLNLQSGVASGYGFRRSATSSGTVPRVLRVLYVEQGSPAHLGGVLRGDTITSVDGVDINDTTAAGIATLNAGLAPTVSGKTTSFGLLAAGANAPRVVTITSSQSIAVTPVALSKVIIDGANTVGYLVLNSFGVVSAEKQLVDAVTLFKNAHVNELVVDLRYNGGGYLDLANELAWMMGDTGLAGKTFEKLTCNDKNPLSFCNTTSAFHQTTLGFSAAPGQALPQLGLKRVFVLTSGSTCSASESVINGLTPFMQVVRIGNTTCGKPYGFSYKDNCGTSYAAMQFKGVNAQGFGDYADGFAPSCAVADDLTRERGDTAEAMLGGALTYMRTGACPVPVSGSNRNTAQALLQGNYVIDRSPSEEVKLLRNSGLQR